MASTLSQQSEFVPVLIAPADGQPYYLRHDHASRHDVTSREGLPPKGRPDKVLVRDDPRAGLTVYRRNQIINVGDDHLIFGVRLDELNGRHHLRTH